MYTPVQAISFAPPQAAIADSGASTVSNPVHDVAIGNIQNASNSPAPVKMTLDLSKALFSSVQSVLGQSRARETSINIPGRKTYKTYLEFISERIRESTDVTRMSAVFRENFFEAHREIVHAVSAKYIPKEEKLLEVGAGALDENNLSYLASLLPKKVQPNITYSDVNPNYKTTVKQKAVPYENVGVLALSQKFGENTFSNVLSCCVFDTINEEDALKGCKEAFKTLKPGGRLVIFSDLMPFQNTLFSHYNSDNTILFPLVGPDLVCHGVQILEKAFLKQWLSSAESVHVPHEAKVFLNLLSQQSSLVRELFAVDIKNEKNGYVFSQYIKSLFREKLTVISHKDHFASKMREALTKAGFDIEELGLREVTTSVETTNTPDGHPNYFINSHGDAVALKSLVLRPGIRLMHCKMHVIVAQKPLMVDKKAD